MPKSATHTDVLVGARVRLRRKELGFSQSKLAAKLGITFQQIQKYEKGANRIGAGRLMEIAGALEVPITYFFAEIGSGANESNQAPLDVALLAIPGAIELLSNFAQIEDPALRKAVQDLARNLVLHSTRGGEWKVEAQREPSHPRRKQQA